MISARESFDAFVTAAYQLLSDVDLSTLSAPVNLDTLYDWAAQYNPENREPKTALAGRPLDRAMSEFVEATAPHKIRMQDDGGWPDLTGDVELITSYYDILAEGGADPGELEVAGLLPYTYLHVYPALSAPADWRIALNVVPADMAKAMAALTPLLDRFADIDHMKFLAPGAAGKADSVIVYLRHDSGRYGELRQAVLDAAKSLTLQPRVGAMWNEIAGGVGEASEPPEGGMSFTSYRCLAVYLAYREYRRSTDAPEFSAFKVYLAEALKLLGIDTANPHLQGALLSGNPVFASWWAALMRLQAAWQG